MENPLVKVPAALPVFQQANALRRRLQARLQRFDIMDWPGVRYGEHPLQIMRLWELNDLAPRDGWPAVLLIHGGGFVEGDLSDFESQAPTFARRGVVAAAMNYRLGPADPWPAQLEDAHAALDRLLGAQVDSSRIAVWGHSSGGQLALMLALQRPEAVRCVVALGAPTDFSPLLGLRPRNPPPMLLIHGGADAVVPVAQARAFHSQWPEHSQLWELHDGDHGIRWPLLRALRARRDAVRWVVRQLAPASRASKWRNNRKKTR